MANRPLTSFNKGVFSPKITERIDTESYASGCKKLENFIPSIYGGVERRPGTIFVAEKKASTGTTARLIPFVFSSDIAYLIEMGDYYMRFFYGGAVLLDGISEVSIETPYPEADLFALQFKQVGDVVRFTHESYAPEKLSRTDPYTFVLEELDFRKGPFLTRNDLINTDVTTSILLASSVVGVGASGTLTATNYIGGPASLFYDEQIGALFKLIHKRTVTEVSVSGSGTSDELDIKGTAYFVTAGTWAGKVILQRQDNGSDWEDFRTYQGLTSGARNDSVSFTEKEDNIKYRMVSTGMSGNFSCTLNVYDPNKAGIVRIVSLNGESSANIEVIAALDSDAAGVATKRWAEGAWSDLRGYPSSVTFFGDRCVYLGKLSSPEQA
jgi:hypothetical protein